MCYQNQYGEKYLRHHSPHYAFEHGYIEYGISITKRCWLRSSSKLKPSRPLLKLTSTYFKNKPTNIFST